MQSHVERLDRGTTRRMLDGPERATVRRFLRASALLMGILVTPRLLGVWMELVHDSLGTCLFLLQLVLGTWFWATRRGGPTASLPRRR